MSDFNALDELARMMSGKPLRELSDDQLRAKIRESGQKINQIKIKLLIRNLDIEIDSIIEEIKLSRQSLGVEEYFRVAVVSDVKAEELTRSFPNKFVLRCNFGINILSGNSCLSCTGETDLKESIKKQISNYLELEVKSLQEEREKAQNLLAPKKAV